MERGAFSGRGVPKYMHLTKIITNLSYSQTPLRLHYCEGEIEYGKGRWRRGLPLPWKTQRGTYRDMVLIWYSL